MTDSPFRTEAPTALPELPCAFERELTHAHNVTSAQLKRYRRHQVSAPILISICIAAPIVFAMSLYPALVKSVPLVIWLIAFVFAHHTNEQGEQCVRTSVSRELGLLEGHRENLFRQEILDAYHQGRSVEILLAGHRIGSSYVLGRYEDAWEQCNTAIADNCPEFWPSPESCPLMYTRFGPLLLRLAACSGQMSRAAPLARKLSSDAGMRLLPKPCIVENSANEVNESDTTPKRSFHSDAPRSIAWSLALYYVELGKVDTAKVWLERGATARPVSMSDHDLQILESTIRRAYDKEPIPQLLLAEIRRSTPLVIAA